VAANGTVEKLQISSPQRHRGTEKAWGEKQQKP